MLGQSRDGISGDTQDRRGLQTVQGKGGSAAGSGAFGATAISSARNGEASPSDPVNRAAPSAATQQMSLDTSTQGKAPPTIGTTSSMGSTSAGKWAHASWTSEERLDYVASLGIVNIPGEEVVLRFLSDAISRAPLPSPWHMARDEQGRTFFANRTTGASTWTHPLEPALRELAGVCRMCLTFPPALRESTITTLLETWQGEAKRELAKWYSVKHENGKEYYCHRETWEAMWEHPAEVVLPMHYLKIRSIERLRDEGYLAELRSQPVTVKQRSAAPAEVPALTDKSGYPDSARGKNGTQLQPLAHVQAQQPAIATSSTIVPATAAAPAKESIRRDATTLPGGMQAAQAAQAAQADAARTEAAIKEAEAAQEEAKKSRAALQDLEEVRKDLESQLNEASQQSAALRSELLHSEDELKSAYAAEERAHALDNELSEERKNTEQAHQDCTELSLGFRAALESVAEAERTKVFLEMRVAAMYQDEGARDSILEGQDDFTRAYLLAAYQEEDERREKILGLDEVRLNLESQLEQLMHQQQGLHSELQAADKELAESRAMAHDFKDFASKAEMELEKERQLVKEATAKASDLVVSRDDAFRQKEALERKLATVEDELRESKATEVVKQELEGQLAEATATKERMQQELTRAEEELSHTRMLGDANKERAIQAEGQLAADRRHFDHALEMMRDAERAKGLLEAKLVNVEQELQEQNALTAKVSALRAEIEEERKASQNNDFFRRELETQLRQSSSNEEKFRVAFSEAEAELRVAKVRGEGISEQALQTASELAQARGQVEEKERLLQDLLQKKQADVDSRVSELQEALTKEQARQASLEHEGQDREVQERKLREALAEEQARVVLLNEKYQLAESTAAQDAQERLQSTGSELAAARAEVAEKEQLLQEEASKAQGMNEQVASAVSRLAEAQRQLGEQDRVVALSEELKAAEAHMAEDMKEQVTVIAAELAEAHHQVAEKDEMVSQLLSTQQGDVNSQLSVLREALTREQERQAVLSDEVAHSKATLEHERREQQEKQEKLQASLAGEQGRVAALSEHHQMAAAQVTKGAEQAQLVGAELADAQVKLAEKEELLSQLLSKGEGEANQVSELQKALAKEQERQAILSDEIAKSNAALEHERREQKGQQEKLQAALAAEQERVAALSEQHAMAAAQVAKGTEQAQLAGSELADAQVKVAEKEELLSQLLSKREGEVNHVSELQEALAREQERQAILNDEIAKSNATLEHERREQKEQQEKMQAAFVAEQERVAALSKQHEMAAAEVARGVEQAQLAGYELADAKSQLAEKEGLLSQLLSKERGDVNSQISVLQDALTKEQERHVVLSDEVAHSRVTLEHERHEQEQKQEKMQAALVAEQERVAVLSEQHEMATAQVAKGVEQARLAGSELVDAQAQLAEKEQTLQELLTKSQVDMDGRILSLQNALTQEKEKQATLQDARREQEAQELQLRKDLAEKQETERGLQFKQEQQAAALETAALQEQQMQKLLATAESELARERELVESTAGRVQASEHSLAALKARMAYGDKERENDMTKLQDALAQEKERAAQIEASRKQLEDQLSNVATSRGKLQADLERTEADLLSMRGDKTRDIVAATEAQLAEQRRQTAHELECVKEAVHTRAAVEARLAKVEAEKSKREVALAAVEKQLKEKEQILMASDALESRLRNVEQNLKSKAKEKEQAAQSDERVRALEQALAQERERQAELQGTHTNLQAAQQELERQLAQAAAWQGKLSDELSSAERELRSTKAVAEDFRHFASEAETALAQERKLVESAQQQNLELSMGKDDAEKAKSALEARLNAMEKIFKAQNAQNHQVQHVSAEKEPQKPYISPNPSIPLASTSKNIIGTTTKGLKELPEDLEMSLTNASGLVDDIMPYSTLQFGCTVKNVDYMAIQLDHGILTLFQSAVRNVIAAQAGGLITEKNIAVNLSAGSVIVRTAISIPIGVDAERVALLLRSSTSIEQSLVSNIAGIDGIERVATGPISVCDVAVSYSPDDGPPYKDYSPTVKDPMSDAMRAEAALSITSGYSSSRHSRIDQWEPAATKFFTKLDRRNTGYVECFQVLQLWPVLSRHVECANAAALAAQMLQSPTPMTTLEWMALMKALHSIVGPRRLRRNIRSAEAYYAELQSGMGVADMPGFAVRQPSSPLTC